MDSVNAPFEMHFIDVGQALSVLVECDGQFMLYDGGNVDDGSLVVSYLQNQGVEQLEYVFCSHAHEDHVGGLGRRTGLLPGVPCLQPGDREPAPNASGFCQVHPAAGLAGGGARRGHVWPLGGATVTLLGPVTQYSDTNDTSLVLRIDYGSHQLSADR